MRDALLKVLAAFALSTSLPSSGDSSISAETESESFAVLRSLRTPAGVEAFEESRPFVEMPVTRNLVRVQLAETIVSLVDTAGQPSSITDDSLSSTDPHLQLSQTRKIPVVDTTGSSFPACGVRRTPALSTYVGNDPTELVRFEQWLGRRVDAHQVFIGERDWNDWYFSIPWLIDLWKDTHRPILWSIPLIPKGASLAEAATGSYTDRYRQAAQVLVSQYTHSHRIYVRTGWEFNADWMTWSALGKSDLYISAFRNFVEAFRSVSDRFIFEWAPNIGDNGMNPEDAYPGDEYVDLIGLDFYYNTTWDPDDDAKAWDYMVNRQYGLKWHQGFAAKRGKPTTYAEWGVMTDRSDRYIRLASEWFRSHNVMYQSYWNSNAAFAGKLSNHQYPTTAAQYISDFKRAPHCAF